MITIDYLCARFEHLDAAELRRWIEEGHIRADPGDGFQEIDVERVRLILELRELFDVNDDALPLVLHLLDEVYALRRCLAREGGAEALNRRWLPPRG